MLKSYIAQYFNVIFTNNKQGRERIFKFAIDEKLRSGNFLNKKLD